MTQRPVRAGPWRNRLAFGVVLVALTGCADSCGPNRANTDDAVLIEFPDARHAVVTVTSNPRDFFGPVVTPRGAPAGVRTSTTSTSSPAVPRTRKAATDWFADLGPRVITKDVPDPRGAMAAIARALGPDTRVDSVRVTPYNQIVGHLTLPDGVADPLDLRPAVAREGFRPKRTVWIGVCRRWGEGRWSRADDAYDLGHGCAGWVPAHRAVSVGTLTSADTHSPLQGPIIWLGLATVALVTVTIAGVAIRRRRWHALVAVVVVIGTFIAAGQLYAVQHGATEVADTFGTNLDAGIHDDAWRLLVWAAVVTVGGMVATFWLALPDVERRRERKHRMYAVEPFDAGIRG